MGSKLGSKKVAAKRIGISLEEYQRNIDAKLKWCTSCKFWHNISDFQKDLSRSDRFKASCWRQERKTDGSANPGIRIRKQMRRYGLRWCKSCSIWLPEKDVRKGLCRVHANENYRRRYAAGGRFAISQRNNARKRSIDPLPLIAQEYLLEQFYGLCAYCQDNKATTWDHIIPITKGGETVPGNIVPACRSCNSSKGNRDVFDWGNAKGFDLSLMLDVKILSYLL